MSNFVFRLLNFSFIIFCISCSTLQNKSVINDHQATDFHMHIHSPAEDQDDVQYTADRALFAADSIGLKRALVLSNAYSQTVTLDKAVKENNYVSSEVQKNKSRIAGACAVEDRIFKTPDPFRIPKKFDRKLGEFGWLGFRMGAMAGTQRFMKILNTK